MSIRSKKHHIVPKALQKHFAARDGYIWYSERGADNLFEAPYLQEIEKAFVMNNYYTVGSGNKLSDIVERKFYGNIDSYLGGMLPKVMAAFAENEIPLFEGESLVDLRHVVFEMIKRTPEFIKSNDDGEIGKSVIESTFKALNENTDHDGIKRLQATLDKNPNFVRETGRDIRVRASLNRTQKVEVALKGLLVKWVTCDSKHSFILTSMMVYRIGNGGVNGLSNPNFEIWMPLSPKVALVLLRDEQNRIPFKITDSRDHIREVNLFAAANSKQIASHSKELIESIAGRKARTDLRNRLDKKVGFPLSRE